MPWWPRTWVVRLAFLGMLWVWVWEELAILWVTRDEMEMVMVSGLVCWCNGKAGDGWRGEVR